jgi:hypothetical protein
MDYKLLLYSILFLVCVFSYYTFHKSWLQNVNKKKEAFVKIDIYRKIATNWLIIVGFAIASIVYFFKAISKI